MAIDDGKKSIIQGDVSSKGFAKRNETYYFFTIVKTQEKAFSQCLRKLAKQEGDDPLITSLTQTDKNRQKIDTAIKAGEIAPLSSALIAFTKAGLDVIQKAVQADSLELGRLSSSDPAFKAGMGDTTQINNLHDPPLGDWDPVFRSPTSPIHGLLKVAGSDEAQVEKKLQAILRVLGHNTVIKDITHPDPVQSQSTVTRIDGAVRPRNFTIGDQTFKFHGKEHFGFDDGISQPLMSKIDNDEDIKNEPNMLVDPSVIITSEDSPEGATRPDWMIDGTFLVFRKLAQDVEGFQNLLKTYKDHGCSTEQQMGAKLMGRWPNGAPVTKYPDAQPAPERPDGGFNNNFDYKQDIGTGCPVAAHVRKTNLRRKLDNNDNSAKKKILRRGIPYGPEYHDRPKEPRGLLFACYQSSIESGFIELQQRWSNPSNFPDGGVGNDPIIGQTAEGVLKMPLNGKDVVIKPLVTMKGGGYFFVPSILALATTLGLA